MFGAEKYYKLIGSINFNLFFMVRDMFKMASVKVDIFDYRKEILQKHFQIGQDTVFLSYNVRECFLR